jgi:hypothetical protein
MNKLSDIAKDYLADYEVLTEARLEFEEQFDAWWRELLAKHLLPALTKVNKDEPNYWDNQRSLGQIHLRCAEGQMMLLEMIGPRVSNKGCFTVNLIVGTMPALKKMRGKKDFVTRYEALARELNIGGSSGLNWDDTKLATEDISVVPDDFEETARQACDAAVRYFRMVIEHHRLEGKSG